MADAEEVEDIADAEPEAIETTEESKRGLGNETVVYDILEKPVPPVQKKQTSLKQFDEGLIEEDVFHVTIQKNRFNALFDSVHEAVILHDGKKILNVNKSFEKVAGYKGGEVIGKTLSKIMKGDHLIKKDGSLVEMLLEQTDAEENFLLIMSDVGSLKEMEKCYALFNILSDHLQDAVLQVDLKGSIVYSNATASSLFGYSDTELNEKVLKELVKSKNQITPLIKKALSGENVNLEAECIGKTGPFLAEITLHNLNNGKEILCLIRDISEEKELKFQIEKAKEKWEQLVNNVTDIIFSIDPQSSINYVNYQFEKQLGYKAKQISSLISIIHPDDVQNVMAVLSESRKGFKNLEFRVQNSKKKWIYFSVNAVPIKDGAKVAGFSGTMRNIDEKKKAEDKTELRRKELEKQNKELMDREKIKSTFVSNVSHDLRTPLTSIQGYSELLSNKVLGELNKEQTEAASVIHGEALRLGKLINDILDVSRIDAGVLVLRKKSFLLSAIEDKCSCRPIADSKGLTIIWNTPDNIGEVYADPDRISQVITNLVSNAIKFTDRGSVTVNAFKRDRNFIQIDVIDTGIGISDKEVKNRSMFERFHRLENKGSKREGTGLGLAIVEDIVKLHGGEIQVESKLGKGSKFFFTIPRYSSIKNKLGDLSEQSTDLKEDQSSESASLEPAKQENSLTEPKI